MLSLVEYSKDPKEQLKRVVTVLCQIPTKSNLSIMLCPFVQQRETNPLLLVMSPCLRATLYSVLFVPCPPCLSDVALVLQCRQSGMVHSVDDNSLVFSRCSWNGLGVGHFSETIDRHLLQLWASFRGLSR